MPAPKESMNLTVNVKALDENEGYLISIDLSYNPEDPAIRQAALAAGVLGRKVRASEDTPALTLSRINTEITSVVGAFNTWADNYVG